MSQHHIQDAWSGWSTIVAGASPSFTLWLTGLPGTGKRTLAGLVQHTLTTRGYRVQTLANRELSQWLQDELHIQEQFKEDRSDIAGYDAFLTYLCYVMARNGIITITASVSPYHVAREYARTQLGRFVEVYLHCPNERRQPRLRLGERLPSFPEHVYQIPDEPELVIDTGQESPERSTLRIIDYLALHGYITPLWEESDSQDEEMVAIKARLQALGYLE